MNTRMPVWITGALLCLPCVQAFGQQGAAAAGVAAAPAPSAVAGLGTPLGAFALDRHRGGDSSVDNGIWIDGTVSDTSATDVLTGGNAIGGGAFANASGIATVIQNSGANVLIQNATIVNVQFTSP
ncbi:hypothetical protein MBSD_n2645 [Mizugakiibacter sediminis]|uniref:Uncharacterized protein n=1 Tax=Mizugakiibacter sediminis TaxID=1475481 RepID=A0A0K8QQX7_9GAMM|nr:hypothetical protein [Mizugakiibacter sediminis]GAP67324.1 hypothetical protein MBSD_n2645 [Mizugakiibacter sediminis]